MRSRITLETKWKWMVHNHDVPEGEYWNGVGGV